MGASSPLILSVSTVFALVGIVLVAIAFATNNWLEYQVDRPEIVRAIEGNRSVLSDFNRRDIYYERTFGLFRECFPDQVPSDIGSYLSPLGATCINVKELLPSDSDWDSFSKDMKNRIYLMRATVALYVLGLALLFFCLFTGVLGCWRRSTGLILTTGILLLFATLFLAGAMAAWHFVDYIQREVITEHPFQLSWLPVLKAATTMNYGWSYKISWAGTALVLIASILMLVAYRAMKVEEMEEYDLKYGASLGGGMYDKQAMVPYTSAAAYGSYPGTYGYAGGAYAAYPAQYANAAAYYNGYMTYGR